MAMGTLTFINFNRNVELVREFVFYEIPKLYALQFGFTVGLRSTIGTLKDKVYLSCFVVVELTVNFNSLGKDATNTDLLTGNQISGCDYSCTVI